MHHEVPVPMAEIAIGSGPDLLMALGLGSCVAVCMHDAAKGIAGLAHVVLPDSHTAHTPGPPGKFADTAIAEIVRQLVLAGGSITRLRAAIVGGAHVFSIGPANATRMEIGARNIAAVRAGLSASKVPLQAEDCGGKQGRTVTIDPVSGLVTVRTVGSLPRELVTLGEIAIRTKAAA